MNYLIIGNGVAGVEAAINIRKYDSLSKIKIITSSNHLHYYRPRLISYLTGNLKIEQLIIYREDFYQNKGIENLLGKEIKEIDTTNQNIKSTDGKKYVYDKLLIATGASSFKPPIPGSDIPGVFTLRSIKDAKEILTYSSDKKEITILGGGILGIEIADKLKRPNNNITIIEMFDRLLPRQLDKDGAFILENILKKRGLNFILNNSVSAIKGSKRVEKITLRDENEINSECIIISAGIRPNIHIAKQSGIETNKGILIDNNFQTSIKNIFSAGDCSEHNERIYGLWSVSKEQGKLAGLSMLGNTVDYKGSLPSTTLKVTDIDLFSSGDFDFKNPDKVYTKKDDNSYLKIVIKNGKIVGAIALGNKQAVVDFKSVISDTKPLNIVNDYFK
ncbi:MAG: NAD(P)/FAD-dependent oxidoreductase [Spirochaetes bacterium]|nr:MAG: NAD(P)/FAD-dependent oxidoreductase [Spirochaetota bacterium]